MVKSIDDRSLYSRKSSQLLPKLDWARADAFQAFQKMDFWEETSRSDRIRLPIHRDIEYSSGRIVVKEADQSTGTDIGFSPLIVVGSAIIELQPIQKSICINWIE